MIDMGYARHVRTRLDQRITRQNETLDAEEKSLRSYGTVVFTPFRRRWDFWMGTGNRVSGTSASRSWVWFDDKDDKWPVPSMMNWMMDGFWKYDEPEYGEVIEVKVSNTTLRPEGDMRELIREDFESLEATLERVPSIMDYAVKELGWTVTNDLFKDFKSSSMIRDINDFLITNSFTFPSNSTVNISNRIIRPDLRMCVRYYPNRDDNRAYCKDMNKLRSITGAALQRLILPKSMGVRRKLEWVDKVCPAMHKDKINQRVTKSSLYVHLVTVLDISNFTGSAANAWLMLLCLALELAHNGSLPEKFENVFCCDGAHFTATVLQIIILYLYTTVGYPCTLERDGSYHYLPGGFLGVNANICIALLFYSTLLHWMNVNKPDYIKYMKCQAGGDDVYIILKLKREDVAVAKKWLNETLTKYVGFVKEDSSFIAEDHLDDAVVPGMVFCRKRIRVKDLGNMILIETEPSLPLNEVFTMENIPSNPRYQQRLLKTVQSELINFEGSYEGYEWITDAMLSIAISRLPLAKPIRTYTHYDELRFNVQLVGRRYCTEESIRAAYTVAPLFHLQNVYYGTVAQSINYLLCRGRLVIQTVMYQGEIHKVVMLEREGRAYRKRFRRRTVVNVMVPNVDPRVRRILVA